MYYVKIKADTWKNKLKKYELNQRLQYIYISD